MNEFENYLLQNEVKFVRCHWRMKPAILVNRQSLSKDVKHAAIKAGLGVDIHGTNYLFFEQWDDHELD